MKLGKKSAFTLIELIIVITIIGVLTGMLVFDFVGAKKQQELSAMADQAVALLQQSQAEVAAGKVRMDEVLDDEGDSMEEAVSLCLGAYFEVDAGFQMMTADYDKETESCDLVNAEFENYGVNTGEAVISEIEVDNAGLDELYVYFVPPEGDVAFGEYEGDALITFSNGDEDEVIYMTVDAFTNKASISKEREGEVGAESEEVDEESDSATDEE